jgi:hypothetical protein
MRNFQKAGGSASWLNAVIAVANMVVVFGVLGPAVAADQARVMEFVINRPWPILLLELFKILSALAGLVVVLAVRQRFQPVVSQQIKFATISGVLSNVLLLIAGVVGAIAITFAGRGGGAGQPSDGSLYITFTAVINGLGLAALFVNGLWYLLVSLAGRKTGLLPGGLSYLGFPLAMASFVVFFLPPVGLLVLLLGLIWSIWLGLVLIREPAPDRSSGEA